MGYTRQDLERLQLRRRAGERIRQLRVERGESQAVLGRGVGTTQASISNYENGKRDFPSWLLLGIMDRYGYALAFFAVDRRHVDRVHQVDKAGRSLCRDYITLTPATDPHARLRMTSAVDCPGCRDVYDAEHAIGRNVRRAA